MQRTLKTTFGLGLLLLVAACGGGGPEALKAEGKSTMEDVISVLESVTDLESAKAATPKLEKLGEKMKDLEARSKELSEEDQKIFNEVDAEMQELVKKLTAESMRIAMNQEASAEIQETLMNMGSR